MAAENHEYRDMISQAVDRSIREGIFDRPLHGFYGVEKAPGPGPRTWNQSVEERLRCLEFSIAAKDARIGALNARLEANEYVVAMLVRNIRTLERAVMNVPGRYE
jgi:uncharacterized coiled-coil protein SlyX